MIWRRGRRTHAVVIGGSIAGMTAARVLAEHFERVTIVERDRPPAGPAGRRGTPQDGHFHALMAEGMRQLDRLFPGFDADLAAQDAVAGDVCRDAAILLPSGWAPRFTTGIRLRAASRRLIEANLRRRLADFDSIEWLAPATATGFLTDQAGKLIGVRMEGSEIGNAVEADLIVDASGRSSHTPDWLKTIGHEVPEEVVVDSSLAYVSRRFRRPEREPDWLALMILADPASNPRYGGIYPEEGGRWNVALAGAAGVEPPTDDQGFLDFARQLRSPLLYQAIATAEPTGPAIGFRNTQNRLRRYDAVRLPDRLVVLGDAALSLNPIYGQGMTTAILGATLLGALVAKFGNPRSLGRRFQRRLAAANRIPWLLATSQDARHGSAVPQLSRLTQTYTDRFQTRIPTNDAVALAFFEALHFLDLKAFVRPAIVARVLAPNWRRSKPVLTDLPPTAIVG